MPMNFDSPNEMNAREFTQHEWDVEEFKLQAELTVHVKELDIQAAKLEATITSWFHIPIMIIKLPVLVLFGIAFICAQFTKKDLPSEFWAFLR